MRKLVRVAVIGSLAAFAATAAMFSCKTFSLPDETCDPRGLEGTLLTGQPNDTACSRCLEESCCDKVGVCERTSNCSETVRAVHDCVLGNGLAAASEEARCATDRGLASIPAANDAYRCMRDRCGSACGLPVCRVDPAAVLIQSALCDRCFAGSCCLQLNACYGSRACKLALECITVKCRDTLSGDLARDQRPNGGFMLGGRGGPDDEGTGMVNADRLCDGGAGRPGFEAGAPSCVQECLCQFSGNDQGLEPVDPEQRPFALAARVYECGVNAKCAIACMNPDASPAAQDAGAD